MKIFKNVKLVKIMKIANKTFCSRKSADVAISEKVGENIPINTIDNSNQLTPHLTSREPEEFRSIFMENLPPNWTEEEIRVRLEQLGTIEKLHIIKNSLGEKTGKIFAVYSKIDHIVEAINNFKDKMPFMKPVKIRFYREFKQKHPMKIKGKQNEFPQLTNKNKKSSVLLMKNIPNDLIKDDLKLFLSEFKEPIYIAYPRDEENEFKNIAYVYFNNVEDADYVLKFANLRYVKNKQLFIQFSNNHYDITDFRTRIELGIKLPPKMELAFFQKQLNDYKLLEPKRHKDKVEYLLSRCRKLEYQLASQGEDKLLITGGNNNQIATRGKKKLYSYNEDKTLIMVNKNKFI